MHDEEKTYYWNTVANMLKYFISLDFEIKKNNKDYEKIFKTLYTFEL